MKPGTRTIAVLLVCLIGAPAILGFTYLGWNWGQGNRDEFAQWLMAVTSAGTLLAAVAAAIYAAGAFRLEVQRDERLQSDRRREQAALVAAWPRKHIGFRYPEPWEGAEQFPTTVTGAGISIRNASQLPVTSVRAKVQLQIAGEWHELPPVDMDVLPPGDEPVDIFARCAEPIEVEPDLPQRQYDVKVSIYLVFRDAAGEDWLRDPLGVLEPAEPWHFD